MRSLEILLASGAVALAMVVALPARAQMPGLPVLQNAFSNPGITAGAVYGHQDEANAYGAAGTWAPGTGWFQLTAGAGLLSGGGETGFTGGGRLSVSLGRFLGFLRRESFGAMVFVGGGAAKQGGATSVATPVGIGVGYRRMLGSRVVSAYFAPIYSRYGLNGVDPAPDPTSLFRVSAGVDVALFSTLGLTVGWEGGGAAEAFEPGPRGAAFGVGVSYALP
jgi:hypothetical protein